MINNTSTGRLGARLIAPIAALLLMSVLILSPAHADYLVDDFEDVSDWVGLDRDTSTVYVGAAAGRWDNQLTQPYITKTFRNPGTNAIEPIDVSSARIVHFWMYSQVANDALIETR